MKKIAGLDSLRFFAFLSIFIFHSTDFFKKGFLGVDFFFVLSSFLLTYLMFSELKNTAHFSRKNFFIRRSLRIFPLYFLVVIFSLVAFPFIAKALSIKVTLPQNQYMYWLFLSNFENSDTVFALKFLWSIAVEEQFYLLFVLFGFLFKKYFWVFVGILIVSYFIYMIIAHHLALSTYTNTLTHFANFSVGMVTAYLYYHKKNLVKLSLTLCITSFAIMLLFTLPDILFHLLLSIWFASVILLFINFSSKLKQFKVFQITEHLGKYTYGLYVYSGFILTLGINFIPVENTYLAFLIEFSLLLIIAFLSYHLYEKHFLKLKKHFY